MGELAAAGLTGLALMLGLIVAIGPQNLFVLRSAIAGHHALKVATLCTAIDVALVSIGAAGIGGLIARSPLVTVVALLGAVAFLTGYGLLAFRAALRPSSVLTAEGPRDTTSVTRALTTTLAVSLLNPHVYVDTIVLFGGVAAQFDDARERLAFAVGAGMGSAIGFFGFVLAGWLLAPVFSRPLAWRVLDISVGVVMLTIAAIFALEALGF